MLFKMWLIITIWTFLYSNWKEICMDRKTRFIKLYKRNVKDFITSRLVVLLICCVPILREIFVLGLIKTEEESEP